MKTLSFEGQKIAIGGFMRPITPHPVIQLGIDPDGNPQPLAVTATGTPKVAPLGDFQIPEFDYQAFTYVGSTNNIATRVFKTGGAGGTTVATLTYTYVADGVADDDDIESITLS